MKLDKLLQVAKKALLIIFSGIAEKNPLKTQLDVPIVLSMTRIVILTQLVVWATMGLKNYPAAAGWPFWTFGAILAIAIPLTYALDKVDPAEVVKLAETLANRLGVGEVAKWVEGSKKEVAGDHG